MLRNKQDQNLALDWYFNNSDDPTLMLPIPKVKKEKSCVKSEKKADPEAVSQLEMFGFNKSQAEGALLKFNNNVEFASDFLFNNPDYVFAAVDKEVKSQKKLNENINSDNSGENSLLGK